MKNIIQLIQSPNFQVGIHTIKVKTITCTFQNIYPATHNNPPFQKEKGFFLGAHSHSKGLKIKITYSLRCIQM